MYYNFEISIPTCITITTICQKAERNLLLVCR